ncbi:MAG: histidine triad nucleotide-binding protein [Candidatus Aminicenantes bacterium]|jgi:histidine triad (HIT) family protein|nr:MAG: histidine triad nucleotide-binding protein [Candidatus Aminicenantes bacterium]
MEDCIFCKIINKEIPASIVFEDEKMIAFNDINPQAPIHILLIPREHFASLNDIPEEKKNILSHLLLKARQIAQEKEIAEKGYRIVLNTEKDSGQEVFHIHFHLLGGRRMHWPPG